MSYLPNRRRSAAAIACAGLALGATALGSVTGTGAAAAPPAAPVAPVADCAEPFPVSEIAKGDLVDGLTVVSGTTPTGFTGEVLGVLEDGIAPDVDMIMVDIDMPAFESTGGVWQGMSGSPVYGDDGRLLGAVAYGLSYGASPIAGVTPFEQMDDYLAATPRPVRLGAADAAVVARHAGITRAQATQGFREIRMPLGVAGVSVRRLAQAQNKGPAFLQKNTYTLGKAGADAVGPETIVAGGNLAASASYGDITMAGVGTATSVCAGKVVGFGHPLFQLGSTTEGLHPADALYIQPDTLGSPFKLANISPVAGTITDDRLTGITGVFDELPDSALVSSDVTFGARSRLGKTDVSVPEALPDVAFYENVANQDSVLGGVFKGTSVQGWTVTGTDDGTPFSLSYTDRFTSTDVSYETAYGLADLAYTLSSIEGVSVDSFTSESDVTADLTRFTITGVQQQVGSTWVPVTNRKPVQAKAGGTVRLRVVLGGDGTGKTLVSIAPIKIPKKASGRALLVVQGGDSMYSNFYVNSVAALRKAVKGATRHDEISVQLGTPDRVSYDGGYEDEMDFRQDRARQLSFVSAQTLGPRAHVVGGSKMLTVKIS